MIGIFAVYLRKKRYVCDPTSRPLHQALAEANDVRGLALSADGQELVSCSELLNVYRHDGLQFILNQTFSLGFTCF